MDDGNPWPHFLANHNWIDFCKGGFCWGLSCTTYVDYVRKEGKYKV